MFTTFQQHADQLQQFIAAAKAAVASRDHDQLEQARSALQDFVATSDDLIPGVPELDDIAVSTLRDLVIASLARRTAALESRSAQLAQLVARLDSAAADNHATAADLRLLRVRQLADAAADLLADFEEHPPAADASPADRRHIAHAVQAAIDALAQAQTRLI